MSDENDGLGDLTSRQRMQRRLGAQGMARNAPKGQKRPDCSDASEAMRCQAKLIGFEVANYLANSASTPVRPPSHICPPIRSVDWDLGIQQAAPGYATLAAGATSSYISTRLRPGYNAVVRGFAWTVAWDSGTSTGDPYNYCDVMLRVGGRPHPYYFNVRNQLTSGLANLIDLTWPVNDDKNGKDGLLVELVFTNTHGSDAVRISGRIKGWMYPAAAIREGIQGTLVEG